ncbi:C1 family peptidase [Leptospira borgpetersenii]|uniref:Papain family cysteine protease n=2 Tax=Leptospira borgpetersenii TaxID=174 RepID=A0ABN0HSN7_LEPBO|nr:C1 family peptidase [Leptospira borgpetersenii]EKP11630.1 papain family cysteine protease [Leptospira borgpetersenii str. 200801926]EMN59730.1 papain family cysteine protease [Leptospira borgpetersenii serovar Javanica str. MK146]ENO63045.1 papain family cysteine protease [Leptospira borgpetersenii serovar Mini str. 201000851]EPG55972.1 papain family cysteine protease [Leptospira borgpetersenii serovar Javanica str. UI 09931]MDQ7245142.1 C1 family peptidase [Leptospira borgpetersenii]
MRILKYSILTSILFSLALNPVFAQPSTRSLGMQRESSELLSSLRDTNPYGISHRGLASNVDLSPSMPPVGNQGEQGSCVAWSTAYATKSFQEYIERKGSKDWSLRTPEGNPNYSKIFSPAFIYNQINGGRDNGSLISDAMRVIVEMGAAPWDTMPYNSADYRTRPSQAAIDAASKYKAKEFLRVKTTDITEVKAQLAEGKPVVAGVLVYENFFNLKGNQIYKEGLGKTYGGHAIAIVGYDDSKNAVKFINSWGTDWGDQGYGYIDYRWFIRICQGAFVMIDQVETVSDQGKPDSTTPEPTLVVSDSNPVAPSSITASQGSFTDKVLINWEVVPNAVGYEIHRKGPGDSNFGKIGLASTNSFNDDGVQPNLAYRYKIMTLTDSSVSDLSQGEVIGFAKTEELKPPPKVLGVKATQGQYDNKIELTWEPGGASSEYQIFKWNKAQKRYNPIGNSKVNSYVDHSAAKKGIVEFYVVSGKLGGKTGEPSDAVSGFTAQPKTPPAKPLGLVASRGSYQNKVELKWQKVSGASKYFVFRYVKSGWIGGGAWEKISETGAEEFIDENLPARFAYYSVTAVNSEGKNGPFSSFAYGYTDPNKQRGVKVTSPENLKGVIDIKAAKISLTWDKTKEASEYYVFRKKRGESKWTFLGSAGNKNDYVAAIPEKETLFLYSVTSKTDLGGESENSLPVSAVISTAVTAPKKRTFGGDSTLEKFKGPWTAMAWDGNNGVSQVLLEIESEDNVTYAVKFNKKKIFEGKYVEESPIIDKDGKFKIEIEKSGDALSVTMKDASIVNQKSNLSFLKE